MSAGLYMIRNTVTGDFYIGSSVDLTRRQRHHWSRLNHGHHLNRYLQRSWDKYGADAFVFDVLCTVPREDTRDREQALLDHVCGTPGCYNLVARVSRPPKTPMTPETRAKIAATLRGHTQTPEQLAKRAATMAAKHAAGYAATRGHTLSDEHRAKISAAGRGRPKSAEWKRNASAAQKGRPKSPEMRAKLSAANKASPRVASLIRELAAHNRGRSLTAEHREKIRIAQRHRRAREAIADD